MEKVKVFNPTGIKVPIESTPKSSAKDIRANLSLVKREHIKHGYLIHLDSSVTTSHYATDSQGDEERLCLVLEPGGRALIPSGLKIQLPEGFSMDVRPRSGLSLKYGVEIVNSPGLIDEDYRGDVGVIVKNGGRNSISIVDGERIAQIKINKDYTFEWEPVENESDLSSTVRGEGGFNSSGTK